MDNRFKHPDQLDRTYKTRTWAYEHGFYGMPGGWIYRKDDPIRGRKHKYSPKPICQGWDNFYRMYGCMAAESKPGSGNDMRRR